MNHIFTRKKFFIMIIPAFLLFTLYQIFPVIIAFYYSLTNFQGLGEFKFFGLKNYQLLMNNKLFWLSFKNTIIITVFTLIISIPFSYILALIVNKKTKGIAFLKAVFFAPYTIALIIVGQIWVFILDPSIGLINSVLKAIGLESLSQQWIGGLVLTPYSAAVVQAWIYSGFMMVILLTGIKMIPEEIFESGIIDGATRFQQVAYITTPLLKESFKIIVVFMLTGCLRVFETVYILTNGGPNHYSETIVSFMYNTTFISHKYGYGMAIAVVEFILAAALSVIFLTATRREIDY